MDIFKSLKTAVKIRPVLIDNEVFQLHYRLTAIMLMASAIMVASKQYFGDPIDCITRDDVPNKIMDTYCWIHATFTLPAACNKTIGLEIPHPCVDKFVSDREDRVYHKYYQWVFFVLFFQACFFYAPHFTWKIWESKLLLTLTEQFKDPLSVEKEDKKGKIKDIVKYFTRDYSSHNRYFYYYTLCEIMNLVNVIIQIYLVDEFLGGTFTSYGLDVLNYIQMEQDDRFDPMVRVFPRMTKCSFHRFGASGDVQKHDALCILPLNIINEKIYVFMWFWFVFLAAVSTIWLLYRALTFVKPEIRYIVIKRRAHHVKSKQLRHVLQELELGDWFVLSMISKNIDSQWYSFLIEELSKGLKERAERKKREKLERRANKADRKAGESAIMMSEVNDDDDDDEDDDDNSTNDTDSDGASIMTDVESGNSARSLKNV